MPSAWEQPGQATERRAPSGPARRRPTDSAPSRQIKDHAQAWFERWAGTYDRSLLNELIFFPAVRACQEELARWQAARGPRPYRILDAGCGTGTLLALTARDPLAELLVGVDYVPAMARQASDKFARCDAAGRLCVLRCDAERLALASASLDVVTCCNSFHHYPHQAAAINEFRRVLRPGGLLVLIDGFRDNVIGWVIYDVAVALIEKHVHHASWSELRALLAGAGFTSIRQRKANVLVPLLVTVAHAAP